MAIITISRGSYSKGKEIAEKLGEKLGYECLARKVLIEASEEFNIPEVKLIRALHDAPSVLERFTYGKDRYISFIRRRLLEAVQMDNVVYHGLAGHIFLQGIPHVLRVRIIANLEDRIKEEMKRENISYEEARQILVKDDQERRKWAHHLYEIDTSDSRLYDLVVHIEKFSVDDAVELIADAVNRPCFKTTPESQRMLDNLVVSAKAESELVSDYPTVKCVFREGTAHISIKESSYKEDKVRAHVEQMLKHYQEIKNIEVHIDPVFY